MNELDLSNDIAADLEAAFTGFAEAVGIQMIDEIDRAADMHRRAIDTYAKRKADARKIGKAALTELAAERKRLKTAFDADMLRISEQVTETKFKTAKAIATADKLAAVSRAALEVIGS